MSLLNKISIKIIWNLSIAIYPPWGTLLSLRNAAVTNRSCSLSYHTLVWIPWPISIPPWDTATVPSPWWIETKMLYGEVNVKYQDIGTTDIPFFFQRFAWNVNMSLEFKEIVDIGTSWWIFNFFLFSHILTNMIEEWTFDVP